MTEKTKKNKIIIAVVIVILIVLGISMAIDYFMEDKEPSVLMYNGYYFAELDNGLWSTSVGKYDDKDFVLVLHNTPKEVEDIYVYGNLSSFFPSNLTYLSYNPETWERSPSLKVALMDLSLKLAGSAALFQDDLFNPTIVCSENKADVCNEIGVSNCESGGKVIQFVEADWRSIAINGSCITLYSDVDSFTEVEDRLLYSWFGVMQ